MDGGSSQLSRVHVWLKLGQLSDGVKLTEINALTVEHVVGVWDRDNIIAVVLTMWKLMLSSMSLTLQKNWLKYTSACVMWSNPKILIKIIIFEVKNDSVWVLILYIYILLLSNISRARELFSWISATNVTLIL